MASDRPIFVVGCPRSGTTMVQLMLHAHPRIAIPPETRFLLTAYRKRAEFGDLSIADNRRKLARFITGKGMSFGDLGLDRAATVAEIVAGPPTLGSAMGIVFRAYARRFDKPRWGDKRPAYLLNLDVVLRMFPDAQIIHIIRDGRDCVASMKEAPWHRGGVRKAVSLWCQGMDAGWRATRTLPHDTYHELYYERLVADPIREMQAICEFLDEEYIDEMAAPSTMSSVAVPERKVWHALTHGSVTDERVGRWQQRLSPEEIALCQRVMGDRLVAHGYELVDADPPSLTQWARYLPLGTRRRLSDAKRAMTVSLHQLRPPADIASQLTAVRRTEDAERVR